MSLHDDLLTAAAYLEGDGVSMEAAEADRIAGVFRSYATALCQQGEPVAYRYSTALLWPDDAPIGEPDCIPLYTHPAQAERDAKDAARYRWLRNGCDEKGSEATRIAARCYGLEWDAAIDAAMTPEGKTE